MLLLLFVAAACAKTVRYTNVPGYPATLQSYDLRIPGSRTIRIIEAKPRWDTYEMPATLSYRPVDFEHRSFKIDDEKSKTDQPDLSILDKSTTIYSPDALNIFLKQYAEKISEEKEKNEDKNLKPNDDSETPNKLAVRKYNHPYDEKEGWVTLDAVPWSSSKISKWQSNHKYEPKPWGNDQQTPSDWDYRPNYSNHPRPAFNKPNYNYDSDVRPNFSSKPSYQIYTPRPEYGFDERPYNAQHEDQWTTEQTTRPWKRPQNNWNKPESWSNYKKPPQHYSNKYENDRDIITDGVNVDFPAPVDVPRPYEPLKERPVKGIHPMSHPEHGNGEWVLVSTTKGYQYPKNKQQRSVNVNPESVSTKKAFRLTVLPPESNAKVNMTKSHGGLLEVESSFESVEESKRLLTEESKFNDTDYNYTGLPEHLMKPYLAQIKPAKAGGKPDPSAVLAAVGAGMVPATMAMLMPFVAGRKKRSLKGEFSNSVLNLTNVPLSDYNSTLQKSF